MTVILDNSVKSNIILREDNNNITIPQYTTRIIEIGKQELIEQIENNNGHVIFSNDYYNEWGRIAIILDGTNTKSSSITFSHELMYIPGVQISPELGITNSTNLKIGLSSVSTTGFTIEAYDTNQYTLYVRWEIKGKIK